MNIHRLSLIEGAASATGAVAVVDTFRAYSTAAYLFDRGLARLVLTSTLDEARTLSATLPGSLLCGEDEGRRPADFDLGNSPGEVQARDDLDGKTVVLRTSAGTRCLLAAFDNGARPIYAASLVVASATARALASSTAATATIVASGWGGTKPADEDEATADLIAASIRDPGAAPAQRTALAKQIRAGPGARRLRAAEWAHRDDLTLCLDIDAFPFAMRAVQRRGEVELERVEI
jgi:2-phosphosulfolactate phosphatase